MAQNAINNKTVDSILFVNRSEAGAIGGVFANHSDNTLPGSDTVCILQTQAGGGEPYVLAMVDGTQSLCWGMDVSDSFSLKETTFAGGTGSPSFGTTLRRLTTTGLQTLPLQPAFMATQSATTASATGNGTAVTIIADVAQVNQNGGYAVGSGIFTAQGDGVYHFEHTIVCDNVGAAHTEGSSQFVISGGTVHQGQVINPATVRELTGNTVTFNASLTVFLTSGQQVTNRVTISNDTQTIGIVGAAASPFSTRLAGYLIC